MRKITEKDIKLGKIEETNTNKIALLVMPLMFMESHISDIKKYMKTHNIKEWRGLEFVNCELYSLTKDEVIKEDDNTTAILYSKVKRYIAPLDNPELQKWK